MVHYTGLAGVMARIQPGSFVSSAKVRQQRQCNRNGDVHHRAGGGGRHESGCAASTSLRSERPQAIFFTDPSLADYLSEVTRSSRRSGVCRIPWNVSEQLAVISDSLTALFEPRGVCSRPNQSLSDVVVCLDEPVRALSPS